MPLQPIAVDSCHIVTCPACLANHEKIIRRLFELKDTAQARKTHFFAGRYENIYLERVAIPELDIILNTALAEAAQLLTCAQSELTLGFWFNIMHQGDVTLLHAHDDDDELLSGTYYLQIPPDSGKLQLTLPDGIRRIEPIAGNFVFFHPGIEHEVTRHNHATPRISLGMNIGPKQIQS